MPRAQSKWSGDARADASTMSPAHTNQHSRRASATDRPKLRSSCDSCQEAKVKCSQSKPACNRCLQHGIKCIYSPVKRIGRPPKSTTAEAKTSRGSAASPLQSIPATSVKDSNSLNLVAQSLADFTQNDMMNWQFNSMDVDLQYPTPPLTMSRAQSVANSTTPVDWGTQSSSGKMGDLFSSLAYQPGNNADGLGNLDKFFNDTDILLNSPYDTSPNLFDPMWDMSAELDMQQMSPVFSEISSSLQFRPLASDLGGDLNDPMSNFYQQSDFSVTSGDASGNESSADRFDCSSNHDGDIFGLLKLDMMRSSSQATPTAADLTNDILPETLSNPFPAFPVPTGQCDAGCCLALMKSLFQLSEGLTGTSTPPSLDVVLSIERETHSNKERVLACKSCLGKNRSSILLLTMVMERLVQVLERRDKTVAATMANITDRRERSEKKYSSSTTSAKWRQSMREPYTPPQSYSLLGTECPSLFKNFEVNEETKRRFIKGLWKVPLRGLISTLKEVEQAVKVDLKDINYRLAKEMAVDVRRRLESLTHQLEIWD